MTLTQKQQAQVAKAPAARRASLRASFEGQNSMAQKQSSRNQKAPASASRRTQGRAARPANAGQAKRLPNFLDPMCPVPAPTVTSDGRALPYTGLETLDFKVDTTNYTVLLATNTGDTGTVGVLFKVSPGGAGVEGSMNTLTIPALALADSAGGPSSSRAMKFSVSVVNCTNNYKRGGRVTYLNSAQRLPTISSNGPTAYLDVITGVKTSPYRRQVNGTDLITPRQLIGFPVDGTVYRQFRAHHGTLTEFGLFERILSAGLLVNPGPRPMSAIAYVFDPVSDEQDYSVTIRAGYYTRWPITSLPGQKMEAIPTAEPRVVNAVHDHVESTANDLVHVAEGGIAATVLPRLVGAAQAAFEAALPEAPAAAEALLPLLL